MCVARAREEVCPIFKTEQNMARKIYGEKALERELAQRMKSVGGMTIKLHGATMAGLPDRVLLLDGKVCFVEVKTTGKKPTPRQVAMHTRLMKLGFRVFVVDDPTSLSEATAYVAG